MSFKKSRQQILFFPFDSDILSECKHRRENRVFQTFAFNVRHNRQFSIFLRITRTRNVLLTSPLVTVRFILYDSYAAYDLYRQQPHARLQIKTRYKITFFLKNSENDGPK